MGIGRRSWAEIEQIFEADSLDSVIVGEDPEPLERLFKAAVEKQAAERRYRQAFAEALESGASYADIARASNITRQAVRKADLSRRDD